MQLVLSGKDQPIYEHAFQVSLQDVEGMYSKNNSNGYKIFNVGRVTKPISYS